MFTLVLKVLRVIKNKKEEKTDLTTLKQGIKKSFDAVKFELNEHLDSINQNSSEIHSIYNFLSELDAKIDKMNERLDSIQLSTTTETTFEIDLTHREQEVFLVLYSEDRITAKEISRRLGFSDEMVNRYVYNLISKGVPILREYQKDIVYLCLDLKFKDIQARKNVLKIDESVSKQLLSDKAI